MKKVVRWIKRWSFLIMLFAVGMVYFVYTDSWEVYAAPLTQAQEWCLQQMKRIRGMESGVSYAMESELELESEMEAHMEAETESEMESHMESEAMKSQAASAYGSISGGDGHIAASVENADSGVGNMIGGGQTNSSVVEGSSQFQAACRNPEDVVYTSVEDDYFADALFIGDSRTVGMYEYGGLEETATFYASTGLTVYKMFNAEIVEVPGQKQKQTVEEALQEKQFAKIYLMIGINEMGTGTVESFMEKYGEVVKHLQELQPDATIYLQGIMKVTTERSEKGDYINNEGIEARNAQIEKLADNVQVFYLDVNPLICDETGGMEASYTFDGVHLKAQYVAIWKDFLKSHAIGETL